MKRDVVHKTNCRICGQSSFEKILDLGEMPLANAFLTKEELDKPESVYALAVYFCKECGLLQLLDIVNPEILFRHYYYLTSTSKPMADHFVKLGKNLASMFIKSNDDLAVEIGGNDAILSAAIKDKCRVLNIEPARNIAKISKEKEIETMEEFFSAELAERIFKKYGSANLITASNVIAHIDNLKDTLEGINILIKDKGVIVFEVHWVGNLMGLTGVGGFDQIYHEHLSYFSLSVLKKLISRFGLNIFDVKLIPIHGYSLQVYLSRRRKVSKSVNEFLEVENTLGLNEMETYIDFAEKVKNNKNVLSNLLWKLKDDNKKIVGYGAPAKGNVLLNYFQIDDEILDFIVDDSPLKQGLYTPGTHIPIYSADRLKIDRPDYLLLLAWNYAESILKKENRLRNEGVKFIIPVPVVKIV